MTERLYYSDSFLYEFDAQVVDVVPGAWPALVLDRSAFYPTTGGQLFDTGVIVSTDGAEKLRVIDVTDGENGEVLHFLDGTSQLQKGSRIHGSVDGARRRDHMQQHSGQHVLSAAFIRLHDIHTVSFHMAADYCSIDLDTKSLTAAQIESAEALANEIVTEARPVTMRYVTQDEAKALGLRKLPPAERDRLRLIDVRDFDLSACGGTHVSHTGQIGCILLRKAEKVRQGWRVEFVCGQRAVSTARRDYTALADSATLLSTQVWDVPAQVRKIQDDARGMRRAQSTLLEELAAEYAKSLLADTPESNGRKVVVRTFADRDAEFIKLLAQRLVRQSSNVAALLASTSGQPTLVFAQSPGQPFDMGALLKETLAGLGGRGGGSKDMAQGGAPAARGIEEALAAVAAKLRA